MTNLSDTCSRCFSFQPHVVYWLAWIPPNQRCFWRIVGTGPWGRHGKLSWSVRHSGRGLLGSESSLSVSYYQCWSRYITSHLLDNVYDWDELRKPSWGWKWGKKSLLMHQHLGGWCLKQKRTLCLWWRACLCKARKGEGCMLLFIFHSRSQSVWRNGLFLMIALFLWSSPWMNLIPDTDSESES